MQTRGQLTNEFSHTYFRSFLQDSEDPLTAANLEKSPPPPLHILALAYGTQIMSPATSLI